MQLFKESEIPFKSSDCLFIPSSLVNSERYRSIGSEAVILYAYLLDRSGLINQSGPEPITLYLTGIDLEEICRATVITRHKAVEALKKLTGSGLLILDGSIPA